MRIIRDMRLIKDQDRGASVAIGNFDGVHLGHKAVIDIARAQARVLNGPLGILTFEPHPRQFFAPDAPPFRLMNAAARAHRLEKLGVERLYELHFDAALSGLTARAFVEEIIHKALGLSHAVVGADFRFGKGRAGAAADLQSLAAALGIGVTLTPLIGDRGGEVSSTNIRRALSDGRPRDAARMLGHWHRIENTVIRGEQRGRTLGFPTANMSIEGLHPPRFGVYAVKVDVLSGAHQGSYDGAASIGVRPMFGRNDPNLETCIFDFSGDLYGVPLSVGLVDYLRPEQTFEGTGALVRQMQADCARARDILAAEQ